MVRIARLVLPSLVLLCSFLTPAAAQWKPNGVPVCSTVGTRSHLNVIPDGAGGFFTAWSDTRDESTNIQDVYLQRVDAFGYPMWTINGIAPNASVSIGALPALVDDGAGGVFVFWSQGAAVNVLDIYGQHYDDSGNALWTPGGIVVCNATDQQIYVVGVSDGSGGAWVAWQDLRYPGDPDIFANRVDAAGTLQWGTSGLSVCGAIGTEEDPRIVSDGLGGCIVAWTDFRGANADIYAQRIDGANFFEWAANGILVTGAANDQYIGEMVEDGVGGVVLTWRDARGADVDVYAQRLNSAGSPLWVAGGTLICGAQGNQTDISMAGDLAGGAVIAWTDPRDSGSKGVYADYIDGDGATHWYGTGRVIAALGGGVVQDRPTVAIVGDGAVIYWRDNHLGSLNIFAQRLTFDGVEMWTPGGVQVTVGINTGTDMFALPDGYGGSLIVWLDGRNFTASNLRFDVYAQRLEPLHGEWGRPEPYVSSANDNPGDQGGYVNLDWWASDRDKQPYTLISYYSTWRATDAPFATASSPVKSDGDAVQAAVRAAEETWPDATVVTSPGDIAPDFEGDAIWVEQGPQNVPAFWEWMSSRTATYQTGYSYLAPTRADSSGAGPATHYFKVIAHTTNQYVFWESQYLSGYSVDNLAPGAPLMLTATRVGNYVRLDWNPSGLEEPDFSQYVVYRANSSGVTPVPLFLLDSTTDDTLWDTNAPAGTPYFYIVTAKDVHGNQSLPSNEADVDGVTTGIGDDAPALTSLQVMGNAPNPFGDATALRVGLPSDSDVELDVFDVAGRRVFTRTYPGVTRGWHDIAFDAHDSSGHALPGGVYFYRVHAAGATVTRKMVLAR